MGKDGFFPQGMASADALRAWIRSAEENAHREYPRGSAAVLIPILIRDGAYRVLYEVRASGLKTQPGEICFPGGRIEAGEDPLQAAVREAREELCVTKEQIEVLGALDRTIGPGGVAFYSFIGLLRDYEDTWSPDEVERVFTLPLEWILERNPKQYQVRMKHELPADFPYEMVPGGKGYKWRDQMYTIPFYPETSPVLWGVTARVTFALSKFLRGGLPFPADPETAR